MGGILREGRADWQTREVILALPEVQQEDHVRRRALLLE